MRTAETSLNLIPDQGHRGLPLSDANRQRFTPDLDRRAYARLQQHAGATTSGTTDAPVDGRSEANIPKIIEALHDERWRWPPVWSVEIPKSHGKTRSLRLPPWVDKLRQEVIRALLEASDEPQCSTHSPGFRPRTGCPTAPTQNPTTWSGTTWWSEGDLRGDFAHRDPTILGFFAQSDEKVYSRSCTERGRIPRQTQSYHFCSYSSTTCVSVRFR
jgi:hypothetical protein